MTSFTIDASLFVALCMTSTCLSHLEYPWIALQGSFEVLLAKVETLEGEVDVLKIDALRANRTNIHLQQRVNRLEQHTQVGNVFCCSNSVKQTCSL